MAQAAADAFGSLGTARLQSSLGLDDVCSGRGATACPLSVGRPAVRLIRLTAPSSPLGPGVRQQSAANLLFALVSRRYERGSIVVTSNRGFEQWGEILGDDVMATALIDRLVHHCHIINIRGNSYRMRQHTELRQALYPQPDERATKRGACRSEAVAS